MSQRSAQREEDGHGLLRHLYSHGHCDDVVALSDEALHSSGHFHGATRVQQRGCWPQLETNIELGTGLMKGGTERGTKNTI